MTEEIEQERKEVEVPKVKSPFTGNVYVGRLSFAVNDAKNAGTVFVGNAILVTYSDCTTEEEVEQLFEEDYDIIGSVKKEVRT